MLTDMHQFSQTKQPQQRHPENETRERNRRVRDKQIPRTRRALAEFIDSDEPEQIQKYAAMIR